MRTYQHIGLRSDAQQWLKEMVKKVPDIKCPDCGKVITERDSKSVWDTVDTGYGDMDLYEYNLADGTVVKEVMQCMPWSSGPMGFLCLEVGGELWFQWTEEEIEDYP